MKKITIALSLLAVLGFSHTSVQAAPIFGIKIHINYERGAKKSGDCEGKGCCKFSIDFDTKMAYQGDLGLDDEGHLILILGQDYSTRFPGDFKDGTFPVTRMDFNAGDLSSLGIKNALTVREGYYPVKYDSGEKSWYVILN